MKVEIANFTTNLPSRGRDSNTGHCGVCDRNLYTTNRQNDSEALKVVLW